MSVDNKSVNRKPVTARARKIRRALIVTAGARTMQILYYIVRILMMIIHHSP